MHITDEQFEISTNILLFTASVLAPLLLLATIRSSVLNHSLRSSLGVHIVEGHDLQAFSHEESQPTAPIASSQNILASLGPCGCPGCCSAV